MTANPIDLVGGLTSTANVPKGDLTAWVKARVAQVLADATELRNTVLAGQLAVTLNSTKLLYLLDAADTTTADDGVTCIVSSDGKRFKSAVGQTRGTAKNDNAAAGNVGEIISSTVLQGSAVSLVTATAKDVTTISLTPGDWDVSIAGYFLPGASTTIASATASLSQTADTVNSITPNFAQFAGNNIVIGGNIVSTHVPPVRVSLAATTTLRFVALANFGVSTCKAFGTISARRVR